jgi:hypothetical protein
VYRPADAAEQAYKLQEMTEEEQLSFVPHPLRSVLQIKEGETVYDACWYPHMNSQRTLPSPANHRQPTAATQGLTSLLLLQSPARAAS